MFWLFMNGHRKAIEARRAGRRSAFLLWSAAAAVCAAIAAVIVLGLCALFLHVGWWWAALIIGYAAMVPVFAGPLVEHVAVPFGAPRLAFFLGKRVVSAGGDPEAVALVWAARAIACHRAPPASSIAWVEAKRDARGRIGDGEVVATGLIAAARGDRDTARILIESAGDLAELHPAVREQAGEWLAADAAERGAWARILGRAEQPLAWPATPTTFLLEGIAARFANKAGAPTRSNLYLRWLEAPYRAGTWSLVARAIAHEPAPAPASRSQADPIPHEHADPLALALASHVALAGGRVTAADLAAAAAAWDRALADADTRIAILSRAAALGAAPDAGDRALRELAASAAADLAELAERAGVGLAGLCAASSPTLVEAARRVRHRLLADLELAFAHLAERAADKEPLPAIDEWRALCALRADYDRAAAAGGLELRRLAFVHAHIAVGRMAVWLWNDRKEHVLSHAMSAWLATEALEVGDAQALETHAQNARLRLPHRDPQRSWWRR